MIRPMAPSAACKMDNGQGASRSRKTNEASARPPRAAIAKITRAEPSIAIPPVATKDTTLWMRRPPGGSCAERFLLSIFDTSRVIEAHHLPTCGNRGSILRPWRAPRTPELDTSRLICLFVVKQTFLSKRRWWMTVERFDVIIVGAGLSGIGAARYLKTRLPQKSFVILETKPRMGGTWDLFRYPGIRSDSDMHTMGYAFKPWKHPKAISEAGAIIQYIEETAAENDIVSHIRYQHRIISAAWSSAESLWTLEVEQADGRLIRLCTPFVFSCAGYYNHHEGYLPDWPGYHNFKGTLVHPQFWPEALDYAGKRIVIIGSGATAVTLAPALAERAEEVVQLQRSPSYVVSRPSEDAFNTFLKTFLPANLAYQATRWRTIITGRLRARRFAKDPRRAKQLLIDLVKAEIGDCDITHFTPDYWPGQQRICRVPDGDMF